MSDTVGYWVDFLAANEGSGKSLQTLRLEFNTGLREQALEGGDLKIQKGIQSLEQFRELVEKECTWDEIHRLYRKHEKYDTEYRREVFVGLITGEYRDLKTFLEVAIAARIDNPPPDANVTAQSAPKTVPAHIPRLIARILYYRLTCRGTPDEVATDDSPAVSEAEARERIGKKLKASGITVTPKNINRWCPASGRRQSRRPRKLHLDPL